MTRDTRRQPTRFKISECSTGVFARENGGGFLTDHFPDSYKAVWDFHGQKATSRHIPGVSYTGITHPGLFGTAPSAGLLASWNAREQALIDTDPHRVPALALPPLAHNALAGQLVGEDAAKVSSTGFDGGCDYPLGAETGAVVW